MCFLFCFVTPDLIRSFLGSSSVLRCFDLHGFLGLLISTVGVSEVMFFILVLLSWGLICLPGFVRP